MSEELEYVIKDNKVDTTETDKKMDALRKKADLLGISYNAKIGMAKLKAKIDMFIEDKGGNDPVNEVSVGPNKTISDIEADAKTPMLVIVRDLDATQQNDPTIITNIGNKYFKIGCITKKAVEQIVPKAVVSAIRAKTMVQWIDEKHAITKRPTGNRVAQTSKRYSIEVIEEDVRVK
jgi:hypothetical protein